MHNRILMAVMALIMCFTAVKADDEIKLSTTIIRPGDFFKIIVNESPSSIVEVRFQDQIKQLTAYNNQFWGLIATSYFTTPGIYPLEVKITKENRDIIKEYPIEVLKRDFPEDRVFIAEKTRGKILTPGNENSDSQKVSAVKQQALLKPLPPLWEGKFIWPVQGKVTTAFGLIRYINNIEEGRHSGIDIAASKGTPVLACNRGKVIFAGTLYVTGLTVIISHGLDLYTSYCHLSQIAITEGQEVKRGDTVGQVGMTGLATGPHLHLTIRVGDICVDPYLFLEQEVSWTF